MEWVRGSSLTRYCDEHRLGIRDRIQLLKKVCLAVQHAHHKGVIHRDLKPSNIIVSAADGEPEPKVIDFGVAKATQIELTDKTIYTQVQQFIGTPAYMSPEQAGLGGLDVDARSDVYSLGALLYELLTGSPPFESETFSSLPPDEVRRLIREVNPPKPSTRASRLAPRQQAEVGQRQGTDGAGLRRRLRGDLDRIVMKAIEKDRGRRYATAVALAEDLERFLNDEPVSARAPGFWYLTCKAASRHRLAFAASGAVALSLVAGTVISVWLARRAHEAEVRAQANERTATNAVASLADINWRLERENYRSDIQLADARIRAGTPEQAIPVLWGTPVKLRDWEWGHLMAKCPVEHEGWNTGHGALLGLALCFSERRLLTWGEDQRFILWDLAGTKPVWERTLDHLVRNAAVSPDDRWIAAVSGMGVDRVVSILDLATGELQQTVELPSDQVAPCWFGNRLILSGELGTWRLDPPSWAVTQRSPLRSQFLDPDRFAKVTHGEDPVLIVPTADAIHILNPDTLNPERTFSTTVDSDEVSTSFAYDPSRRLLACGNHQLVRLSEDGSPFHTIWTNAAPVRILAFLPGSDRIVVSSANRLTIINTAGMAVADWGVPHMVRRLQTFKDGRIATADVSGILRIYTPSRMTPSRDRLDVAHEREVRTVTFDPTDRDVIFMDWMQRESHWVDVSHGTIRSFATPQASVLWRCAGDLPTFRPGTAEFVTAGTNSVLFHDLGGEGAELLREMPLRGRLPIAAFDGKGQHLLVAHSQGVEWLDLAAGETQLIAAEQGLGPTGVAVSADGAVAAYCGQGSVAEWRVWRTSDFTSVARHELKSRPVDLALHPSGQFLAIASEGRDIEIWDLVGNTTVSRLPDAKGAWDLHFAGRRSDRLIACCVGTTIRIWDWKLGQEILTLPFDRRVSGLCFSDDGTALATGSYRPEVSVRFAEPWWFEQGDPAFYRSRMLMRQVLSTDLSF